MSDLPGFLLARITEREAAAERAVIFRTKNGMAWIGPTPETATVMAMSGHRLFAQCVAERAMLELYEAYKANDPLGLLQGVLELVALPDADHPDYQREWTRS